MNTSGVFSSHIIHPLACSNKYNQKNKFIKFEILIELKIVILESSVTLNWCKEK